MNPFEYSSAFSPFGERPRRRAAGKLATALLMLAASPTVLLAASNTWTSSTDGGWSVPGSWSGGVNVPGAATGSTNADTATFNTSGGVAVSIDSGWNVKDLTFTEDVGSFTFSGGPLTLTSGGTLQISAATSTGQTETFDTGLTLAGSYTFSNDSSGNLLYFGTGAAITNSAAATLTLKGTNTGNNTIAGAIGNGTGVTSVIKTDGGTWILAGSNTYTGTTTISGGTLKLGANNAINSGNALSINNAAGVFDLNGYSQTLGKVDMGSGAITNTSALSTTLTIGAGSVGGYAGTVSGNLDLIWEQTSGATTIYSTFTNSGNITLKGAGGSIFLGGNINNEGSITNNGSGGGATTISGSIGSNVTGVVQDSATSGLKLSGENTFTTGVRLEKGTLILDNARALGTGTLTINGGTISVSIGEISLTTNNEQVWNAKIFYDGYFGLDLGTGSVSLGTAAADAGANRTVEVRGGVSGVPVLTVGGTISDGTSAKGITKAGTGVLVLSGANDYTGSTNVTAGILNIRNSSALGTTDSGTVVANGATLQLQGGITVGNEALTISGIGRTSAKAVLGATGALQNISGDNTFGGLVTLGATSTLSSEAGVLRLTNTGTIAGAGFGLTLAGAGDGFLASVIGTGGGGLTKTGSGTWTLSGASTYTGTTVVNGGRLVLDFSQATSANDLLSNSRPLHAGGGTLSVKGKTGTTNSQTFASLTLNAGSSAVDADGNGASSLTVALGGISRNVGATVDFSSRTGAEITTTAANTASILGGWATANNGSDWATKAAAGVSPGAVVALASYADNTWATTNNTTVTSSNTVNNGTTNSLRFNAPDANTVTLEGTNTITSGGILVTANVGSQLSKITDGVLRGASDKDLVVIQNNTQGDLIIDSQIADNGSATALTKSGNGKLILAGVNTYTGKTYLNAGTLSLSSDANLGAAPGSATAGSLSFNGGTLETTESFTLASNRGIALGANGGIFDVAANTTLSYGGIIAGSGGFSKIGAGKLTLKGVASGNIGTVTVNNGTLALDYSGNAATGSLITSSLVLGGGTLEAIGRNGAATTQTFNGTTFNAGASTIRFSNAGTANMVIDLGGIIRKVGATVDFQAQVASGSVGAGYIAPTHNNDNGILGGWATTNNGSDWATRSPAGAIVALTSYTNNTWASTNNTTVISSNTVNDGTTNSLRFNAPGANTVTLAGTNTISSGGILVTTNVGSQLSRIIGGVLKGAAGKDLVVIQNNTAGDLLIGSQIADNGSATALTKSGDGMLILAGANTYTGETIVNAGTLLINNTSGSGTGAGAIMVNQGTLGGLGLVQGAVTIGDGILGHVASLAAGDAGIGTFTTQSSLTFASGAAFIFELNSFTGDADMVIANGLSIDSEAQFSFNDLGNGTLAGGLVITLIRNTSEAQITGMFANLLEGELYTWNQNEFRVSYQGGNGNDLVLTVIPEPETYVMLGLGLLVVVQGLRRNRELRVG